MGMDAAGTRWGAPGRPCRECPLPLPGCRASPGLTASTAPWRAAAGSSLQGSQNSPLPFVLLVLSPSLLQQAVLKCRLARLLRRGVPRVSFSCCAFGYRAAHQVLLKQTCSHAGTGELHSPHIHVDVRAVSCATS